MAEPVKKPAVDNDQDENEFIQKMKDGVDALLDIKFPNKCMESYDKLRERELRASKSDFYWKVKDGAEALLNISIPTKGMTLDDMRRANEILSDEHVRLRKK